MDDLNFLGFLCYNMNMQKKFNKFFILKTSLMFMFLGLFLFFSNSQVLSENSADAIAIRIIPNYEHYSADQWYGNQNFSGSPQSIIVNGYAGVRDGRTVYVNVGNVAPGGTLYTNIYLITYNQDAESATSDIFGNILNHWQFNTNISDIGHCRGENSIICDLDEDCPIGDFCDSFKSLVVRDTKRLEDLALIRDVLENYYKQGNYPILEAGTYLPNKTISVWPSWQEAFSDEINYNLPLDPVNKLGKCCPSDADNCDKTGSYNENTCWDENKKIFATDLPNQLPDSSLIYFYNSSILDYNLCAFLESGLDVAGKQLMDASCPEICIDMDYDGYGLFATDACSSHPNAVDCDDTDVNVGAGGAELCSNGIDDDCDGLIDCDDTEQCAGDASCVVIETCDFNNVCGLTETCDSCPKDCCPCGDDECNEVLECSGKIFDCPEDCKCGNDEVNCGEECDGEVDCDSDCTWLIPECTDIDQDRYIKETTNVGSCDNVCGTDNNQPCLGNNDCDDTNNLIFPGNPDICDGLDNNCSDPDHSDGIDPAEIDEGYNEESCGYLCEFDYDADRVGALRCCGDDSGEGGFGASVYENPESSCDDGVDNDCDGTYDNDTSNPENPDTDCLECNADNSLNESFWYLFSETDCNQCDHDGDDDGDQFGEDWSAYFGMADKCDSDCGVVDVNVARSDYENGNEVSCDGIDNDCDGEVDEDLAQTFYLDNDGDGEGNPDVSGEYCSGSEPVNYVDNSDDCDDSNDQIYSGQTENCDGIDNDCDGTVDEGCVSSDYCRDSDDDGYGDPNDMVSDFSAPDGYVSDCTDCNDDPDAGGAFCWPGNLAGETCDGYDNECDGEVDEGCDDDGDNFCDSAMLWFNTTLICDNTIIGPNGDDCDDNGINAADRFPGNPEICDGIDNDCDSNTADGSGNIFYEADTEITCDDNEDNDCDGDVDADDSDCANYCELPFEFPCEFN